MNPDSTNPPRDSLEARLTALLLGELSPSEAAEVQQALAHDPELARLHERLKQTIGLVREAVATSVAEPAAPSAPLQMTAEKREKLLERFKVIAPTELAEPQRRRTRWYVPASVAAMLVGLFALATVMFHGFFMPKAQLAKLDTSEEGETGRKLHWMFAKPQAPAAVTKLPGISRTELASPPPASTEDMFLRERVESLRTAPAKPAQKLAATPLYLPARHDGEGRWDAVMFDPTGTVRLDGRDHAARGIRLGGDFGDAPASLAQQVERGGAVVAQARGFYDDSYARGSATPAQVGGGGYGGFGGAGAGRLGGGLGYGQGGQGGAPPSAGRGGQGGGGAVADNFAWFGSTDGTSAAHQKSGVLLGESRGRERVESAGRAAREEKEIAEVVTSDLGAIVPATGLPADQGAVAPAQSIRVWDVATGLPIALPPAALSPAATGQASAMVPLPVKLPRPSFKGTPDDLPKGPHIEPLHETLWADAGKTRAYHLDTSGNLQTEAAGDRREQRGQAGSYGYGVIAGGLANNLQANEGKTVLGGEFAALADAEQKTRDLNGPAALEESEKRGKASFGRAPTAGKPAVPTLGDVPALGLAFRPAAEPTPGGRPPSPAAVATPTAPPPVVGQPLASSGKLDFADGTVRLTDEATKFYMNGVAAAAKNLDGDEVEVRRRGNAVVNRFSTAKPDAKPGSDSGTVQVQGAAPPQGGTVDVLVRPQVESLARAYTTPELGRERFGVSKAAESDKKAARESRGKEAGQTSGAAEGGIYSINVNGYVTNTALAAGKRLAIELPKVGVEVAQKQLEPVLIQDLTELANQPAPTPALQVASLARGDQPVEQEVALRRLAEAPPAVKASEEKAPPARQRELDLTALTQLRDKLVTQIAAQEADSKIPKSTLVEIADPAKAEQTENRSLWGRVAGALSSGVERTARIHVERPAPDMAGLADRQSVAGYDPYWTQTEFEAIQSKAVLGKVAEKLKLNEAWAEKHGAGGKLNTEDTIRLLKDRVDVRGDSKSSLIDVRVKSDQPEEAARIANTIAQTYAEHRQEASKRRTMAGVQVLKQQLAEQEKKIAAAQDELARLKEESAPKQADEAPPKPPTSAPIPQPEVAARDNSFSTFSLNVSDVSFKLAAASLEKGVMPDVSTLRSEEFINAFDYRDPEPPPGVPVAFAWERARYPFAHNRELLRFSVKTAAIGRQAGKPLNLVLLLDNSGSMERADRVRIIQECLRVLAGQLQAQDKISVLTFSRTARLWVDGLAGGQAREVLERVSQITPEGGTNLGDAMDAAYATGAKHYLAGGVNRVVVLTDGAANLGNVEPESLKQKVEAQRKQGIALDCFGIGWEGYNDDLLEVLSRNGDGRYGFVNSPEEAATEFAGQLAGALQVAASDVKVQVEFNPRRVTTWRQIGYAKHQLKKEQFRDNTVDAAEIAAAEAGNALYTAEVNPHGDGPLAIVRVRFRIPGTSDYREHEWPVPFTGSAVPMEQASAVMRLASTTAAFSEWLASSPFAAEVTPDRLLGHLSGVPEVFGADPRPKKLEWMIRQAKSVAGR